MELGLGVLLAAAVEGKDGRGTWIVGGTVIATSGRTKLRIPIVAAELGTVAGGESWGGA